MRIKNLARKGGVADIVTLMIIVGLVIALIIAVVLPMIDSASSTGGNNEGQLKGIGKYTENLGSINEDGTIN